MPAGDRTGPEGRGPRTGRGLGYCSGYSSPGFTREAPVGRRFFGRGLGRGWGRGFGPGRGRRFWRRNPYPYDESRPYYQETYDEPTRDEEKKYLENLVKDLEEEIKQVKNRLRDISDENKENP